MTTTTMTTTTMPTLTAAQDSTAAAYEYPAPGTAVSPALAHLCDPGVSAEIFPAGARSTASEIGEAIARTFPGARVVRDDRDGTRVLSADGDLRVDIDDCRDHWTGRPTGGWTVDCATRTRAGEWWLGFSDRVDARHWRDLAERLYGEFCVFN